MTSKFDPQTTCLKLRCKQMFYEEKDEAALEHDREVERAYGACDTTAYWCDCTQTGRGPDGQRVARSTCQAGRVCFEKIVSFK